MSRTLKIVIFWLLVFALPLQGFASSGMLACGGAHHHVMSTVLQHDGQDSDVARDHADHNGQFSFSSFHQDTAGEAHISSDQSGDGSHHHGTAKCNACSSCCLTTAISFPVWLDPIAPLQTGLEFNGQSEARFTVYFPEGLERPPHSLDS